MSTSTVDRGSPSSELATAIRQRTSLNPVDTANALKVEVFVLSDDLLDRRQIGRRPSTAPTSPKPRGPSTSSTTSRKHSPVRHGRLPAAKVFRLDRRKA
jgi:hypothetical protein